MSDERNTITGTSGNEELTGTSGNDLIKPRDGIDVVYGVDGDDWINAYLDDAGGKVVLRHDRDTNCVWW